MRYFTNRLILLCGMLWLIGAVVLTTGLQVVDAASLQKNAPHCDLDKFYRLEADFQQMTIFRAENSAIFSDEAYKATALSYLQEATVCYYANAPSNIQATRSITGPIMIDDEGKWASEFVSPPGSEEFNTFGTKWGSGSPYAGGQNQPGPGLAGGIVTYSFIKDGISHGFEGLGGNIDVRTGLGIDDCVETEISNAFAAWSAVANLQFVQVADNDIASNGFGAGGDIRIGAHPFDGPFGSLAHAFFPPPNNISVAGDIHFDVAETWSCTTGGSNIDIGLIALHEIGHAIGLRHEPTAGNGGHLAVMNGFYNPSLAALQLDDIEGAGSIYGVGQPLNLTNSLLNDPATVTASAILTYKFVIQNLSSQAISNVSVNVTIPDDTTYITNSAAANQPVDLSNFPPNVPSFTLNGLSSLEVTYNLQVDPSVDQGDLLINTATVNASGLAGPLQKTHTAIVEPSILYLPLFVKQIW